MTAFGGRVVVEAVLHCAALSASLVETFAKMTPEQVRAEIDRWHRSRVPPFRMIGYHGIFMPDGAYIQGRGFSEIGAHVVGHNSRTIGFLMIESKVITKIGRFEDWFTEAQRKAVKAKIRSLGLTKVTGHNDFASKLCPGFKVHSEDWL